VIGESTAPKPFAMPPHDGARLDEYQGGAPLRPECGKGHPEQAVSSAKTRPRGSALYGSELLPQRDILENQLVMSTASDRERPSNRISSNTRRFLRCVPRRINRQRRDADFGEGQAGTAMN
jgi:hypothetical protein